jgi:ECF transporter S component (folate family)
MQKRFELKMLIVMALLTAIGAVFKAFISVDLFFGAMKISDLSLIALPVMLAGIYYGPLAGGIVGFVSEMASFFIMPVGGGYNPAFSAVMAVTGIIAGLFYLKSQKTGLWKTIIMVVVSELICTALLTTLLIHLFYGIPWVPLLIARGIAILIKIPLLTILVLAIADRLRPLLNNRSPAPVTQKQ